MTIPDLTLTASQVSKASLRDVNGDGLADLLVDRPVPGELWFWPNRGNRNFGTRIRITGMGSAFSPGASVRWVDMPP